MLTGALALAAVLFLLLIRHPDLALAIFFNGHFFYLYILFKLGIPPDTILTGTFLTSLIAAAIIGFVLRRPETTRLEIIDAMIATLLLWMVLSMVIYAPGEEWSLKKLSYAPVYVLASFAGGRLVSSGRQLFNFTNQIVTVSKIQSLICGYELLTATEEEIRLSVFNFGPEKVSNPILLSTTFAIAFLSLYVLLLEGQKKLNVLNASWLAWFLFLAFRAASRGALVALILSILGYHAVRGLKFKHLVAIAAVAAGMMVAYTILPEKTSAFYEGSFQYNERANSVTLRAILWRIAWEQFKLSPIVGNGFGRFTSEETGLVGLNFAHNLFLETSAELGVIGLVILVLCIVVTVLVLIRSMKAAGAPGSLRATVRAVFALFVFALLQAQFSGHLANQYYFFLTTGLAWGVARRYRRRSRKTSLTWMPASA